MNASDVYLEIRYQVIQIQSVKTQNILLLILLVVSLDEIKSESLSDPGLCSIIQSVNTNFWDKKILPAFYRVRNDLIVKNSILLKSNSLVLPKLLRKRILYIAHQHHLGMGLLREKVWWPGIDQDVGHLIKSCHSCQVTSQTNNISVPVVPTEIPENCWDSLAIDLQGPYPTGNYLLALIDYRSSYPCAIKLTHVTTRNIITELDKVFNNFGQENFNSTCDKMILSYVKPRLTLLGQMEKLNSLRDV